MFEPEPQRTRVRVEDPTPQPDPARTGCLWVGGILGVIVGVVVTFFAVPSILNFLFPSETIGVGETFEDDKLTIEVASLQVVNPERPEAYGLGLRVEARSSWKPSSDNFVLVLENGLELRPEHLETQGSNGEVPQGKSIVVLLFGTDDKRELARPDSLHLEEPPVKFELRR